jgi:hypothetical protein
MLCQPLVLLLCLCVSGAAFAADDDYLKAIEVESGKLESRQQDVDSGETQATPAPQTDAGSATLDVRDKFEKILDEKYHGSYVFYQKLPERSRQEIVNEYEQGTPFEEIRKKIIDRFLQR